MSEPSDWSDPCQVLAWMRPLFYRLAAGEKEIRVVYAGRDTTWQQGSIPELRTEIARLEIACAAKTDPTKRRRAIIAG